MQYREMERSFIGLGNYTLAPEYAHYRLSQSTWTNMTDKQRQSHTDSFMKDKKLQQKRTITSTDGTTAIQTQNRDIENKQQPHTHRTETKYRK